MTEQQYPNFSKFLSERTPSAQNYFYEGIEKLQMDGFSAIDISAIKKQVAKLEKNLPPGERKD